MWEYTVITLATIGDKWIAEELNNFGQSGWELVTAIPMGSKTRYIFKRKKG